MKPGAQRPRAEHELFLAAQEIGIGFAGHRLEAVLRQVLQHGFAPPQAFRQQQDAAVEIGDELLQPADRIVGAAIHLNRGQRQS